MAISAGRYRDRRRGIDAGASRRAREQISIRAARALRFGRCRPAAHLGDRLAHGAARRARDLYGYAVLRAVAVHRGYAHPGAHLVRGGGGRSAGTAGDRGLRQLAHPRGAHAEPLSQQPAADHPAVFALLDWHAGRSVLVSARCADGYGEPAGDARCAGVVLSLSATRWVTERATILELRGLGAGERDDSDFRRAWRVVRAVARDGGCTARRIGARARVWQSGDRDIV